MGEGLFQKNTTFPPLYKCLQSAILKYDIKKTP